MEPQDVPHDCVRDPLARQMSLLCGIDNDLLSYGKEKDLFEPKNLVMKAMAERNLDWVTAHKVVMAERNELYHSLEIVIKHLGDKQKMESLNKLMYSVTGYVSFQYSTCVRYGNRPYEEPKGGVKKVTGKVGSLMDYRQNRKLEK